MLGGPSAGCAGWDGVVWFPLLQLNKIKPVNAKKNNITVFARSESEPRILLWLIAKDLNWTHQNQTYLCSRAGRSQVWGLL